jgi:hypothetical protein
VPSGFRAASRRSSRGNRSCRRSSSPQRTCRRRQRRVDEGLAAETGIDRHQQHEIELLEHVAQAVERHVRIEDEAGAASGTADCGQGTRDVGARFRVKADERRAGFGKPADQDIGRLDHQMRVDADIDAFAVEVSSERLADWRPDRQIRHVVIVHDVEVDQVGAGLDDGTHLFAETGEIGGQNRRRNPVGVHRGIIS